MISTKECYFIEQKCVDLLRQEEEYQLINPRNTKLHALPRTSSINIERSICMQKWLIFIISVNNAKMEIPITLHMQSSHDILVWMYTDVYTIA